MGYGGTQLQVEAMLLPGAGTTRRRLISMACRLGAQGRHAEGMRAWLPRRQCHAPVGIAVGLWVYLQPKCPQRRHALCCFILHVPFATTSIKG